MAKITACIDGSKYLDSVCFFASWAALKGGFGVNLLHATPSHDEFVVKGDLSGAIGLGVKSALLKKLTEIDEKRTGLHLQKGAIMLDYALRELSANGITNIETLHRRGTLSDALTELYSEIIIMGKRGEENSDKDQLGANIKKVARTLQTPILIAPTKFRPIKSFLIAYDGSKSAKKAVEYVCESPIFAGLDCHLLTFYQNSHHNANLSLKEAETALKYNGFDPKISLETGETIQGTINDYVAKNNIDLLAMGAFGHSKIRNFIIGSATEAILAEIEVAAMIFA